MSKNLGPVSYSHSEAVFLGRDLTQQKNYSEETSREIDKEIRTILDEAENKSMEILKNNREKLQLLADMLLKKETLNSKEIDEILEISVPKGVDNGPA